MELRRKLRIIVAVQFVLLLLVSAGALFLDPETASTYYLFEFIGILGASIVTVFGLMKMRELT